MDRQHSKKAGQYRQTGTESIRNAQPWKTEVYMEGRVRGRYEADIGSGQLILKIRTMEVCLCSPISKTVFKIRP